MAIVVTSSPILTACLSCGWVYGYLWRAGQLKKEPTESERLAAETVTAGFAQ